MQAANYRVVLDACVLANIAVCDIFLRLAETPKLYVPLWSKDILDETQRTQLGPLKWEPKYALSFRSAVESAFPEAMVSGYERIVSTLEHMQADPDDRHVLAAAIRGHATTIVTFNVRDFPPEAVQPWDLEVRHPSDYLLTLYSISPAVVVKKLGDICRKKRTDVETLLITTFGVPCPGFATKLLQDLT